MNDIFKKIYNIYKKAMFICKVIFTWICKVVNNKLCLHDNKVIHE